MRNAAVDPLHTLKYRGHSRDPSNYTSNPIRAASIVHAFVADVTFATVAAAIGYTEKAGLIVVPSHFCQTFSNNTHWSKLLATQVALFLC